MALAKERMRNIIPRLLRRERAAAYLDISEPIFDELVKARVLPSPRQLTPTIKAWDRDALDRAVDLLPFNGSGADTSWDD